MNYFTLQNCDYFKKFFVLFQYLGSTVIKELRGTESTKKSIQKLKKNEKIGNVNAIGNNAISNNPHHNSKRAVFILISYRGVQFIDPQTKVG